MISTEAEARARVAVDRLEAIAGAAEEATAGGMLDAVWSALWDLGPARAAAAESARQSRKAADTMRARFVEMVANPTASDADADRFVADCAAYGGAEAAIAAGKLTSAAGGAAVVADGIRHDAAAVAGTWAPRLGVIVLVAGAALAVLTIRDWTRKAAP